MTEATPMLNFPDAIKAAASKVFQFNGRSRRSEYWWTTLLVSVVYLLVPLVGGVLNLLTIPLLFRRLHDVGRSGWWWGVGALLKLAFIATMAYDVLTNLGDTTVPDLLHTPEGDALLIKYVSFFVANLVYEIVLIVLCCLDSEPFENKYGPSPKHIDCNATGM